MAYLLGKYDFKNFYNNIKDPSWPDCRSFEDFALLDDRIKKECIEIFGLYDVFHAKEVSNEMIRITHLEWHAAHACNFSCESCAHLSNHGVGDKMITVDQLKDWFAGWKNRIIPKSMAIVGGEPLLNKQIIEVIKLSRDSWTYVPGQFFRLTTNGTLLHRYPDLPKVLAETGCALHISYHGPGKKYDEKWKSIVALANEWQHKFGITVYRREENGDEPSWSTDPPEQWSRMFNGFGEYLTPYKDNDPESSWANCPTGQNCFQLLDGNIYKCAPIAYLPLAAKKYKLSSDWNQYLAYQPLTPDCTLTDIRNFFDRGAESVCSMCPTEPIVFQKKDPLIPVTWYKKNINNSALPVDRETS